MLNLRILPALLLLLAQGAHAGDYEIAAKMQKAGAEELALSYMRMHPQAKPDIAWKTLEIGLLAKFDQNAQVLDLADQLPFSGETARLAIRSAFALQKPASARNWLAELIWKGNLSKSELRQARLRVIRSYLLEKDGKNAYYAMLRFSQDYRPVAAGEAGEFVDGLVSTGMANDAAPWLVQLDDKDPRKIRAELATGLIGPDDAIRFAPHDAQTLLEAAKMKKDASLEIAAKEMLLASGKISPEELWKSYLDHSIDFSNRYALLQGNYDAWYDPISKIPDPSAQRALLAYLSVHAPASKEKAIFLLLDSLKGEPGTAIALFSKTQDLPPVAREILGKLAFEAGNYPLCVQFWDGIPTQDPLDFAAALLETGQPEKAANAIETALGTVQAIDPAASNRILLLADRIGGPSSKSLLETLLPLADSATRRTILMRLGQLSSDPKEAAAYYFRAATLTDKPDDLSKRARFLCLQSLRQAGFLGDAKALGK